MPKIKPYMDLCSLEKYCRNQRELVYYMRGWFDRFAFGYKEMKISEIKRYIEDLKVAFIFLDRGFKDE